MTSMVAVYDESSMPPMAEAMRPIDIQCPECSKPAGELCASHANTFVTAVPGAHKARVHFAGFGLDVMSAGCVRCSAKPGEVCTAKRPTPRLSRWPHAPRVDSARRAKRRASCG